MNKIFLLFSLLFYNAGIAIYSFIIKIISLWNLKAKKWIEGRKDIFNKISASLKPGEKRIWFHCASLGEFEQGRPLIELIKKQHPNLKIVLSFFSPSGYEIRKDYPHADYIFYLPADSHSNAKKLIRLINPEFAVFVKYEFWYHYFRQLEKHKIPLIIICASFRKNQVFFKWYGGLFRRMLNSVTHFFVQDEKSVHLLRKKGFGNTTIVYDTRIDRVSQINKSAKPIPEIEIFLKNKKCIIGGSLYPAEAELLRKLYVDGVFSQKLIIAPHNIDLHTIKTIKSTWGENAVLFTESTNKNLSEFNVMIVDTIGILSSLYNYASVAIIGGGFGKGLHNILEPAAAGLPILFGPNYHKFKEAHELLASGGAFTFHNYEEIKSIMEKLKEPVQLQRSGFTSLNYIQQRTGGTEAIYNWILNRKMI